MSWSRLVMPLDEQDSLSMAVWPWRQVWRRSTLMQRLSAGSGFSFPACSRANYDWNGSLTWADDKNICRDMALRQSNNRLQMLTLRSHHPPSGPSSPIRTWRSGWLTTGHWRKATWPLGRALCFGAMSGRSHDALSTEDGLLRSWGKHSDSSVGCGWSAGGKRVGRYGGDEEGYTTYPSYLQARNSREGTLLTSGECWSSDLCFLCIVSRKYSF